MNACRCVKFLLVSLMICNKKEMLTTDITNFNRSRGTRRFKVGNKKGYIYFQNFEMFPCVLLRI